MLQQQKEIVKATVPVLQQHGETITTVFYRTLFDENPSLFNIFNPANQRNGGRLAALLRQSSLTRRTSTASTSLAEWSTASRTSMPALRCGRSITPSSAITCCVQFAPCWRSGDAGDH